MPRAEWIEIESLDVEKRKLKVERFEGEEAIAIQRGLDHLDGVLFIDRCKRENFGFMYTQVAAYSSQVRGGQDSYHRLNLILFKT